MRHLLLNLLAVAMVLSAVEAARAEREPEDRKKADFVIVGMVKGVYSRDTGEYHHYIVEVRVDEVEKGRNFEAGGTFYVYCFDRKASAPIEPAMSGHAAPPKEGQRIKAFVKERKGKHEAIYPNWYDQLQPAGSKKTTR
ncbi:MAG: hypothetical protein WD894_10135 [Pirellulales bacterium]